MLDKGKLKKIKKQNELNNAKIKSFGNDSTKIYNFKIAQLQSEKVARNKAGYGSYNLDKDIENTQSKLNNYTNKKFLTADEASAKQAAMINRKQGGDTTNIKKVKPVRMAVYISPSKTIDGKPLKYTWGPSDTNNIKKTKPRKSTNLEGMSNFKKGGVVRTKKK
jgi:hypothetical protein